MNEEYEAARRDPALRQSFLETVDMEEYSEFSGKPYYIEDKNPSSNMGALYAATKNGLRVFIYVNQLAFENFSWIEFYNVLVHHEGFHAKQFHSYTPDSRELLTATLEYKDGSHQEISFKKTIQEIEAYDNQMAHDSFLECSDKFVRKINSGKEFYKNLIEQNLFELSE